MRCDVVAGDFFDLLRGDVPVSVERRAADALLQVGPQHVEERDEHRQLHQQRQARRQRIDLVLLVELHQLLLLALFVLLVLLFQRVDLGRQALHLLHRLQLPEGQRHEDRPDQDGQADDRQAPAAPDEVGVDEDHDRLEQADQRRERVLDHIGEDGHDLRALGGSVVGKVVFGGLAPRTGRTAGRHHPGPAQSSTSSCPPAPILNTRWASTGSYPPWLHGLHLSSRHPASTRPLSMPYSRIASTA